MMSCSSSESSGEDDMILPEQDSKQTFVLHIDDETDEDVMSVIMDPNPARDIIFCNSEVRLGSQIGHSRGLEVEHVFLASGRTEMMACFEDVIKLHFSPYERRG